MIRIAAIVLLALPFMALCGCTIMDESDRQGIWYINDSLEQNRPELAGPVASALAARTPPPKVRLPVNEESKDKLAGDLQKKRGGALNLFGKLLMGALTLGVAAAGGGSLFGRDC